MLKLGGRSISGIEFPNGVGRILSVELRESSDESHESGEIMSVEGEVPETDEGPR